MQGLCNRASQCWFLFHIWRARSYGFPNEQTPADLPDDTFIETPVTLATATWQQELRKSQVLSSFFLVVMRLAESFTPKDSHISSCNDRER